MSQQTSLARAILLSETTTPGPTPSRAVAGVSWRAVVLAVVLIPPACWWLEYTECVSEGTDMAGISYVLPALFFLFLLVAANRVSPARRVKPLSQGELLTVFVMFSAGLTIGGPRGVEHLV